MSNLTFDQYEAKYETHRKLEAEALPRNKAVLFNALAAAGIVTVTVEFDGSGDSGQMEKPCARGPDGAITEFPAEVIELERTDWNFDVQKEQLALSDAVETMAWRLLGEAHGGWENEDGAYGQFTLNVAERTIALDYNERYIGTHCHDYTF